MRWQFWHRFAEDQIREAIELIAISKGKPMLNFLGEPFSRPHFQATCGNLNIEFGYGITIDVIYYVRVVNGDRKELVFASGWIGYWYTRVNKRGAWRKQLLALAKEIQDAHS